MSSWEIPEWMIHTEDSARCTAWDDMVSDDAFVVCTWRSCSPLSVVCIHRDLGIRSSRHVSQFVDGHLWPVGFSRCNLGTHTRLTPSTYIGSSFIVQHSTVDFMSRPTIAVTRSGVDGVDVAANTAVGFQEPQTIDVAKSTLANRLGIIVTRCRRLVNRAEEFCV